MDKIAIIEKTAHWTSWWLDQRKNKLREHLSDTMSLNPFLLPILYELHCMTHLEDLFDLTVDGHLMTGHSTGFGKLMDEKILPEVFGTVKLTADFRRRNPPFQLSCFDEIDHLIVRQSGAVELLSLKASKWSIQLSMAVQLNHAFSEIASQHIEQYPRIVVGVFYGTTEGLTDKYNIVRGINTGADHSVVDLTKYVSVYAGKAFWKWLNDDEELTQFWVLQGIQLGVKSSNPRQEAELLLSSFKERIVSQYTKYIEANGEINWELLLTDINE